MARDFDEMIRVANERYEAMTEEQKEEMWRAQKENYVRSEMSWTSRKRMEGSVIVYESYEDYCA